MTYNPNRYVCCPLCERGKMIQIYPIMARCTGCWGTISNGFFEALRQIGNPPEAEGKHPCECGHSEMRRLPDGAYRCPSCGSGIAHAGGT